ncbi:MAG: TonB-dependent receptor plug domain-containing protein [Massilia sp.]
MTKATAIHIAVLMLCSAAASAQNTTAAAPAAGASAEPEIQKVVIVSTGGRGSQRTVIDAPVPVDILSSAELTKSGQNSLDKALGFRVPSFNTVQTPVNDATSLLDPYEIRNMGPSRALILINGKRKNSSALVYVQTSPGRGESGADISAIPSDAIKRIEVLRDGASAQYGSDAIAGVVNIILKDSAAGGAITARLGETGEHDGKSRSVSINKGFNLMDRGFVNVTLDLSKTDLSSRSGKVSAAGEKSDFGPGVDAQVDDFLRRYPDARNINGSPETKANKFLVNAGLDLDENSKAYGNFAFIKKDVFSYANFRTPYWRPTDYGLLHPAGTTYDGYGPTFTGHLQDYNATFGVKSDLNGWASDVSITTGGNEQIYEVGNTVNRSLGAASPTNFHPGGANFKHAVFNADMSKQVAQKVNMYFGTELRWEQFDTIAGEPVSYENGGADSFAGNDILNSGTKRRRNYGVYAGGIFDITDKFLIDAIGREEKYSDFGNAFVWKLSSRYKVNDKVVLRGSLSTGFRAPSLHQLFTQKTQYSFVAGQGIQQSGLFNNDSPVTRGFGQGPLKPEKSDNITLGFGVKPDTNTSMTLDYYHIKLKDRIILGKEIGKTGDPTNFADITLTNLGIVSASFFTNAVDSTTSGLDFVFNKRNMNLAGGKFGVNFSGNYTLKNERDGDVNNPAGVAAAHQSVLDATQEALMFTSRPKHKEILGLDFDYSKVNFSLNNTVFGPTTFRQAGLDSNLETRFKTKVVTDFAVNYAVAKNVTLSFNINNIFDVTPKWEFKALNATGAAILNSTTADASGRTPSQVQSDLITFNGRYSMVTYDGSQFSQLGRTFSAAANWRF